MPERTVLRDIMSSLKTLVGHKTVLKTAFLAQT